MEKAKAKKRKQENEVLDRMFPFRVNSKDVANYFAIKNKYARMLVADKVREFFQKEIKKATNQGVEYFSFNEEKFNQELEDYKKDKFAEVIV